MRTKSGRSRPRLCYLCARPATVAVQQLCGRTVLRLNGRTERFTQWEARYVCVDHEDHDPWDST